LIALFAEAVRPIARPVPDEQARALGDLVARRRQLVDMLTAEQNRQRLLRDRGLHRDLEAHITRLDDALGRLEADLTILIRSTPIWRGITKRCFAPPTLLARVRHTLGGLIS
jgi:transposase